MKKVKALFRNAKVRLAARAFLAAAIGSFTHFKGGHLTYGIVEGFGIAGVWAAVETFTPVNGLLGVFKQAEKIDPALAKFAPPTDLPAPKA